MSSQSRSDSPVVPASTGLSVVDVIEGERFERTEVVGCPLCGSHHVPRLLKAGYGMRAAVAECRPCRIAYQSLRPSPEATLAYMNWRWGSSDTYVADPVDQLQRARLQLGLVQQYLRTGSLLDFGAGSGAFVRAARDAGFEAVGVERSGTAIANARQRFGIDLQLELVGGDYDVVTLWDVVEHLRDPQATLAELRRRMRPGGRIFLETGNWKSWRRLKDGDRWGLFLLDHHFYFTPSSLGRVATGAGFRGFHLVNRFGSRPWLSPSRWFYRMTVPRRNIMIACAVA